MAAESCPSQAQAKRLSCSAHLLSIRLVSLSSPRRAVYVEHKLLLVHETVLDDARFALGVDVAISENDICQNL